MCGRKKVKGSRFMDTNTNGRDRDSYTHSTYCGLYRRIWLVVGRVLGFHDRLNFLFFIFNIFLIERRILWGYNNHRRVGLFFHVCCCISLFSLNENVRDAENFRGFLITAVNICVDARMAP